MKIIPDSRLVINLNITTTNGEVGVQFNTILFDAASCPTSLLDYT